MQFYGAIQAFRENKYPDNIQIDETLTYVIDHSPLDESKLSYEGSKLINDVRDILETVRFIRIVLLRSLTLIPICAGAPFSKAEKCRRTLPTVPLPH